MRVYIPSMPTKKTHPTKEELLQDPLLQEFIFSRNIKEKTIETYIAAIQHYSQVTGKTITELIEEAEKEEDSGVKRRKRKIRQYFLKYIQHLQDQGVKGSTIRLYISKIKALYNEYEIDPPKITYKIRPENKSMDDLINLHEIKNVLDNTHPREKAMILLHLTSGMGSAELRRLNVVDYNKAIGFNVLGEDYEDARKRIQDEEIVGVWKVNRVKTGMPYVTFSTPEANIKILDYLRYRRLNGGPLKETQPLFSTQNGDRLKPITYANIFNRLNDRFYLGRDAAGNRRLTSHKLRKLFTTILYKEGMDKLAIDWLLGHKVNPVTEAYFKVNIDHLEREYRKRMRSLTFEKTVTRRVMAPEVREIVKELEEKENEIKELRESQEKLREWVKKTEKLYNVIMSDPEFLRRISD